MQEGHRPSHLGDEAPHHAFPLRDCDLQFVVKSGRGHFVMKLGTLTFAQVLKSVGAEFTSVSIAPGGSAIGMSGRDRNATGTPRRSWRRTQAASPTSSPSGSP